MSPSGKISEAMVEAFKAKYREFWPGAWPPDGPMSKEMHEVLRASILAALSSSPVGEMVHRADGYDAVKHKKTAAEILGDQRIGVSVAARTKGLKEPEGD